MNQHTLDAGKPTLGTRLKNELIKYGVVSGYLFVSFSLLILYEATVTGGAHQALPFTLALVKALVLGKFLLIGEAFEAGSRADAHSLVIRVAWKTLAFLIVLLILRGLEELVVGWFHDKSAMAVINDVLERSLLENLAPVLIMSFILIPLISISECFRQLGPEKFRALCLARPE
jgi:hypothetical protein